MRNVALVIARTWVSLNTRIRTLAMKGHKKPPAQEGFPSFGLIVVSTLPRSGLSTLNFQTRSHYYPIQKAMARYRLFMWRIISCNIVLKVRQMTEVTVFLSHRFTRLSVFAQAIRFLYETDIIWDITSVLGLHRRDGAFWQQKSRRCGVDHTTAASRFCGSRALSRTKRHPNSRRKRCSSGSNMGRPEPDHQKDRIEPGRFTVLFAEAFCALYEQTRNDTR